MLTVFDLCFAFQDCLKIFLMVEDLDALKNWIVKVQGCSWMRVVISSTHTSTQTTSAKGSQSQPQEQEEREM